MEIPSELIAMVQGGGNLALVGCAYFIHRATAAFNEASQRLARIEKALDKYLANQEAVK